MKKQSILFTIILCLWVILETYLTVVIPQYQSIFYDGLATKNLELFYHGLYLLGFVYISFTFGLPGKAWLTSRISQAWRWNVTEKLLGRDITHITNVDGRIAEDIRIYTDITVRVITEIIIAVLCLVGLVGSLWADKQLFMYCLGYIVILMILTKLFKKPMQGAKFNQQEAEQSYRAHLLLTNNQADAINQAQASLTTLGNNINSLVTTLNTTVKGVNSNVEKYNNVGSEAVTGPTSDFEKRANAVLQRLMPGATGTLTANQLAKSEEYGKISEQLAGQQAIAAHSTNAFLTNAYNTNPSLYLSKVGRQGITHMLQGNVDSIVAKNNACAFFNTGHRLGSCHRRSHRATCASTANGRSTRRHTAAHCRFRHVWHLRQVGHLTTSKYGICGY